MWGCFCDIIVKKILSVIQYFSTRKNVAVFTDHEKKKKREREEEKEGNMCK